jgi:hypothetical protein
MKDYATYVKLLDQYENYLNLLEDLIIIRSQVEAGSEEYTLELELEFVDTRADSAKNSATPVWSEGWQK